MPLMIVIEDAREFCHMVSAHYNYVADNHTMRPVDVNDYKFKRKKVTAAYIVQKA